MVLSRSTVSPRNPSDDYVTQYPWASVGQIFDIHAALAADEMDYETVKDLSENGLGQCVIWFPENGTVAAEFRFYAAGGASANDDATVEVYVASGDDYYRKLAQLTVTIGEAQRASATQLFADTIAEAAGEWWLTDATLCVPDTANQIATWAFNVHGVDRVAFLVSAATGLDLDPAVAGTADESLNIEVRRF